MSKDVRQESQPTIAETTLAGAVHPLDTDGQLLALNIAPGLDANDPGRVADADNTQETRETSAALPQVAGYEILGILGRGGMGIVYKARQQGLNRLVALKMILAGSHAGPELFARFRTEAEAVARLQHPNIVQIYEIGEAGGHPFFSLEFVNGGSLARQLTGAPQPPHQAAELVHTLAQAMHVAHQHGIVHRDLKPGNILLQKVDSPPRAKPPVASRKTDRERSPAADYWPLTSDYFPKISDFGLAKRLDDQSGQTQSGSIVGTPNYMAPEQAEGKVKETGPPVDIYALGAILYELLTGRAPFRGESVLDTLNQVRTQEPVPPKQLQPRVPRDLETICLKCLQKEPRKRYAGADVLAEDLRRFKSGEPILARPVSAPERFWRWCGRNPKLAILSGAVALLLLTVAVSSLGFAWQLKQEQGATLEALKQADANARAEAAARRLAEERATLARDQHGAAIDQVVRLVEKLQKTLSRKVGGPESERADPALRQELNALAMEGLSEMARDMKRSGLTSFSMLRAHYQMGTLFRRLGEGDRALAQYEQALESVQGVARDEPENDKARGNLAFILAAIGRLVLEWKGDCPKARDFFRQALEVQEDLQAHPRSGFYKETDHCRLLSGYHHDLGVAYVHLGNPGAARAEFLQTLALREMWAGADPDNLQARSFLAEACNSLGDVSWRLGDLAAMVKHFDRCLEICESLAEEHPNDRSYKKDLAEVCATYGDARLRQGKTKEANADYQRALLVLQHLAAENSEDVGLPSALARANYRLGTTLLKLGKQAEAGKSFREASRLYEQLRSAERGNVPLEADLIVALARCARCREAAEHAEELSRRQPQNGEVLLRVARCYALCASATGAGSAERRRLLEQSIRSLRALIEQGYHDRIALHTDPDLDRLRDDPELGTLLAQIKDR
jgi:serine/threonine-protein kinase